MQLIAANPLTEPIRTIAADSENAVNSNCKKNGESLRAFIVITKNGELMIYMKLNYSLVGKKIHNLVSVPIKESISSVSTRQKMLVADNYQFSMLISNDDSQM